MENQNNDLYAKTQVKIPNCRFFFNHLDQPYQDPKTGVKKFKSCIVIDKNDKAAVEAVNGALAAARELGIQRVWRGQVPATLRMPVADGDTAENPSPVFIGKFKINVSSNKRPKMYDRQRRELAEGELRGGDYGIALVRFKAYDNQSKGIAAYIEGILKTKDSDGTDVAAEFASDFETEAETAAAANASNKEFHGFL